MRIGLIGATLIGNRGAEAMVSATVTQLGKVSSNLNFTLFSYFPISDKKLKQSSIDIQNGTPEFILLVVFPLSLLYAIFVRFFHLRFLHTVFPKEIRDWSESSSLIDVSGVSFMDVRAHILPYDILIIIISNLLGTPFVKFSQAMGPFNSLISKTAAKLFLPGTKHIFARGESTYNALEKVCHKKNYSRSTDIALLHSIGDSLTDENSSYIKSLVEDLSNRKNGGEKIVGICPSSVVYKMSLKKGYDYLGFITELCEMCIDRGYTVLLYPNATKDENMNKTRNNDLNPIIKIQNNLKQNSRNPHNKILNVDRNINTDGIKRLIQNVDLSVVSRFHAMIASLELIKPVIILGWSHKYLEVMNDFELGEWVFDYTHNKSTELFSMIEKCYSQKSSIEKQIEKNIFTLKELSKKQIDYITSLLNDK
jgi:colanic acid/amylovoran biosynthesis protein